MLPISDYLPQIADRLSKGRNLVLQAEPGAGKSTALPLSLLAADWLNGQKILMLEPRRVAARSIAHYLAMQLNENVGQRVGYQVRNDRKVSKQTELEIVTEGILTRRLQADPELTGIGLIIFDEFHERSIHADLSLMLALEIQQSIRQELRLLVMSATIDTTLIASYMHGADVLECPGRSFPVSVAYRKAGDQPLNRLVTNALGSVLDSDNSGDTLVFLPGQADIRRCMSDAEQRFQSMTGIRFLPLYGGLSLQQQEQALIPDPDGNRRVVFTTNIAETSLTIQGVTCVVDSGLEKILQYDPASGMTRLQTTFISKASAEQRAGRAGRTQEGTCIRLWDESKQRRLREFQGEEILSADLTGLVLDLMLWGGGDFQTIRWLTPPPEAHYETARATLESLAMIDSSNTITALGRKAARLGIHPRLAAMLLKVDQDHTSKSTELINDDIQQGIACELAALLTDKDIFANGQGSDLLARMLAIQDYKTDRHRALKTLPLRRAAVEQLLNNSVSLRRLCDLKAPVPVFTGSQLKASLGSSLLDAYPDRLAVRRSDHCGRYQLANGKGVFLYDDDPLFGSPWLVVADCDAQKKEGRIFTAASIDMDEVMMVLEDHFIETDHYQYDTQLKKITGRRVISYQAIQIKSSVIQDIPKQKFQACLQQVIEEQGLECLNWTRQCQSWLTRVDWLGRQMPDFPDLSKNGLMNKLDQWLLPYLSTVTSMAALKRINVFNLLRGILSWDEQQILEQEAPQQYLTPGNKTVPIIYDEQQGPTVSVVLQEMFGQVESPKLAKGKVALRFELLSPAGRPIQTTSDLANFWKTSYFDVRKDMKGRYPKHRWPEQPLLEKPGRSIKSK